MFLGLLRVADVLFFFGGGGSLSQRRRVFLVLCDFAALREALTETPVAAERLRALTNLASEPASQRIRLQELLSLLPPPQYFLLHRGKRAGHGFFHTVFHDGLRGKEARMNV